MTMSRFSAITRIRRIPIPVPVGPRFADLRTITHRSASSSTPTKEHHSSRSLAAAVGPMASSASVAGSASVPTLEQPGSLISAESTKAEVIPDDGVADFSRPINWFDLYTLAALTSFGMFTLWKWRSAEHVTIVIGPGEEQETKRVQLGSVEAVNRTLRIHGESKSGRVGEVTLRSELSGMPCKDPVKGARETLLPGDVIHDEDFPRMSPTLGISSIINGHESGYIAAALQKYGHLSIVSRMMSIHAPGGVDAMKGAIKEGIAVFNRCCPSLIFAFLDKGKSFADQPEYEHDINWALGFLATPDDGASMVSTILDGKERMVYVAAVGRGNAVAAYEKDGRWRCDVLFEDQCDIKRAADTKLHTRLEGDKTVHSLRSPWGSYPERTVPADAAGQALKRWTNEEVQRLKAFADEHDYAFDPRRDTGVEFSEDAQAPRIVHRPLTSADGEKLRFVIAANEGIWEQLSPEQATLLTAARLDKPSNKFIPLKPVGKTFTLAEHTQVDFYAQGDELVKSWEFEGDENAGVHLVRNAMGRGDQRRTRALMSSGAGERVISAFMDEMLVNVVFFDEDEKKADGVKAAVGE